MPNIKKDVNMNDLRKLVSAYNKEVSIKTYRNSNREGLLKKLKAKNYEPQKIKSKKVLKAIKPMRRNKNIS